MNMQKYLIYLLILAGTTYLIRAIPFAFVKKQITNKYIKSFLYFIPYTVLAAMTFPAILYSTTYMAAAAVGFCVAVTFALLKKGLVQVALASCISVFIMESLIRILS